MKKPSIIIFLCFLAAFGVQAEDTISTNVNTDPIAPEPIVPISAVEVLPVAEVVPSPDAQNTIPEAPIANEPLADAPPQTISTDPVPVPLPNPEPLPANPNPEPLPINSNPDEEVPLPKPEISPDTVPSLVDIPLVAVDSEPTNVDPASNPNLVRRTSVSETSAPQNPKPSVRRQARPAKPNGGPSTNQTNPSSKPRKPVKAIRARSNTTRSAPIRPKIVNRIATIPRRRLNPIRPSIPRNRTRIARPARVVKRPISLPAKKSPKSKVPKKAAAPKRSQKAKTASVKNVPALPTPAPRCPRFEHRISRFRCRDRDCSGKFTLCKIVARNYVCGCNKGYRRVNKKCVPLKSCPKVTSPLAKTTCKTSSKPKRKATVSSRPKPARPVQSPKRKSTLRPRPQGRPARPVRAKVVSMTSS